MISQTLIINPLLLISIPNMIKYLASYVYFDIPCTLLPTIVILDLLLALSIYQNILPLIVRFYYNIRQYMDQNYHNINASHIIQALTIIHQPGSTVEQIRTANTYLAEAQTCAKFAECLLMIYSRADVAELQLSSLLLLSNVIKRNWSNKNISRTPQSLTLSETEKEQLRILVLSAYSLHQMKHYKHFNHLLRYLTRADYPLHYPQLHHFVLSSLRQLAQLMQHDVKAVTQSSRVMAVLSTCKAVLKEYNLKKVTHNQQIFVKYITDIIKEAVNLSQQMHAYMRPLIQSMVFGQLPPLLQCLRKLDKVTVYGLGSMPSLYQYNSEINQIVAVLIGRIGSFDQLIIQLADKNIEQVLEQLQKYNAGLLQQASRLQVSYPFLFSPFLNEYLSMLVNMLEKLASRVYSNQKLMSAIVTTNYKPFNTFAYNMPPQEFKNTIYCRKNSQIDNNQFQKQCSESFRQFYSPSRVCQMLNILVVELMTADHIASQQRQLHQQLVLEDVEITIVDQVSEPTVYQNCVTLCKSIIKCFKQQARGIVVDFIRSVPELSDRRDSLSRQLIQNIMEIVLVIPHIYDSAELPIEQICAILEVLYNAQQFTYLARVIRKYHQYLSQTTILNAFTILARIAASQVSEIITAEIIYQCALGLKTILIQIEGAVLPMELLGGCITNIVSIMSMPQFTTNPTLTWPMMNLLVKLVKSISEVALVQQAGYIIVKGLSPIIQSQKNEQLIVCALSELISTLIQVCLQPVKSEYLLKGKTFQRHPKMAGVTSNSLILLQAGQMLVQRNIKNMSLQSLDNIYGLWLCICRHYPTLYQQQVYCFELVKLNNSIVSLFKNQHLQLLQEDPVILVEIIEELFLIQILPLSQKELLEIFMKCLNIEQAQQKRWPLLKSLASLYLSFAILQTPTPQILLLLLNQLVHLKNKISQQVNALRTFLFLVIDWHILKANCQETFNFFNSALNNQNGQWLQPFFWSMQFVSNKFAFKLNSAIIIKMMSDIGINNFATILTAPVKGQHPINWVLRVIAVELQPVRKDLLINSYNNLQKTLLPDEVISSLGTSSYRKVRLQVGDSLIEQFIEADLRPSCAQKLHSLMDTLDWSREDLQEHVGSACLNQLCDLLHWPRKTQ